MYYHACKYGICWQIDTMCTLIIRMPDDLHNLFEVILISIEKVRKTLPEICGIKKIANNNVIYISTCLYLHILRNRCTRLAGGFVPRVKHLEK